MTRPRPKCLPRPPSPRPARWAEGPTGNGGKGHVRSDRRGGGREARARPLGVSPPRGFPASVFHAPLPGPRALRTELLSFQPLKATGHSPSCLRLLTRSLGPVDSGFFFFDFLTGVALGAAWWIRCCHVKDPRVLPILVAGAGQTDWAPDGSRRLSRAVPVWLGGPSGCWGPGPVPGVRRSLRHGVLYSLRLPGWQWLVPPRPLPKPGVLLRHSQMPGPGPWRGVTCGDLSGSGRPPQPQNRARPLVQARFPNVTKGKF